MHNNGLLILTIFLAILAVLVVAARFYCRLCLTRNAGADDWMLLAAMVPTLGFAISVALSSEYYGLRNHVWDLEFPVLIGARKITFANEFLYLCSSVPIKLSILLFYRRLAAGILPRAFVRATWAIAIFVLAYFVSATVALFFTCQPFYGFWERINPEWRLAHPHACVDEGAAILTISSISALQDFLVALLPTLLFARLPMPARQKLALGALFGFGFFLCVAGVMRIVYVQRLFYESYDSTWILRNVWLSMIVEVLLSPIVASAPALRVLFFSYIMPRFGVDYSTASHEMSTHASGIGPVSVADARRSRNRDSLRHGAVVIPDVDDDEDYAAYRPSAPSPGLASPLKKSHAEDGWLERMRETEYADQSWGAATAARVASTHAKHSRVERIATK